MLDWTPDKLAHNASNQSELQKTRQAIPEFNGGNIRYKGSTQGINQSIEQRTRVTGERRQPSEVIQPA